MRCCVIQFIKSERGRWGETLAAEQMGIAWHTLGAGFTWQSEDLARDRAKAEQGWALAQTEILSGNHDLIVLDEFTYPLHLGWLDAQAIVDWLRANRPPALHLVITGRNAVDELMALADLITEMHLIKHPYDEGLDAQRGIEF
jgi:cob(I)alamin adenosyltransferase